MLYLVSFLVYYILIESNLKLYCFYLQLAGCDPPNRPVNGNISLSSNALTVTYSCDLGYTLSGTSERLCQDDGTGWSDIQPSCCKFKK